MKSITQTVKQCNGKKELLLLLGIIKGTIKNENRKFQNLQDTNPRHKSI